MGRVLSALLLVLVCAGRPALADVTEVKLPFHVAEIVHGPAGVYVTTLTDSYRAIMCGAKVCVKAARVSGVGKRAVNGLPDGEIAIVAGGDIRAAWYAAPTRRYRHGVLGDAIEAGALVAIDQSAKRYHFELPETHVFEDITPRLFDLNGDGRNEVITIRSSLRKGAAVAIYGLRGDRLVELAATREIGRSNRWLNISGIARYFGNKLPIITWVETPHIGGVLHMAIFEDDRLIPYRAPQKGYSNHVIGSRALKLSATADFDRDGLLDLALPSAKRDQIRFVTAKGVKSVKLKGRVLQNLAPFAGGVLVGTEKGKLYHVRP